MIALDEPADEPLTEDEIDEALIEYSKPYAKCTLIDFRAVKGKVLRLVRLEQFTRREAIDTLRRKYVKLLAEYLRIEGTTYAGWIEHGPAQEWEEVLEAARDEAVWDRLVERGLAELRP